MMKKLMALCLVLFSFTAHAEMFAGWTDSDKRMFVASELVLAADWATTRNIAKNPNVYSEQNKILGQHPPVSAVNAYFVTYMVGNYLLADYLGPDRFVYLSLITITEGAAVVHNRSMGLSMRF